MAHAQKLQEQVKSLTARIRDLEATLAETNGGVSRLSQDPRENSANEIDVLYEKGFQQVSESMGSLSIGSEGQSIYHGESAATELSVLNCLKYLKELLPLEEDTEHPERITLPYELLELMNAFPFGMKSAPYIKSLFTGFLPSRARATFIADLYYKYVAWMQVSRFCRMDFFTNSHIEFHARYDPITRKELESDIFDQMYFGNQHIIDRIHSHRLSAFFMVMAAGVMYDPGPDSISMAKRYHALAKAALSLDPITQEVSCATMQSLLVMFRFHYNLDRRSNEIRWLIIGVCSRVALKIGLPRDGILTLKNNSGVGGCFWELYMNDTWTSIVNGRPPSMMIQHTDCQFPEDLEPSIKANGDTEIGWHAWKARYAASCLSISAQHIFSTKKLPYAAMLDLDTKIRKFPIPSHLQAPLAASEAGRAWSSDPRRAMQQYCVLCERESNLLYLHRSFFAQAIREEPHNPLTHRYTASVLATYRSACRLILSLKGLYPNHPEITETSWFFWSGVFSSCIVLGALIVESPACSLSSDALKEFEDALPFFQEGSRILPSYQYSSYTTNSTRTTGGKVAPERPKQTSSNENPDVYEVLGGRKSVITLPSSNSPKAPPMQRPQSSGGSSGSGSIASGVSDGQMMDYYESLVSDMSAQERQHHFQHFTHQTTRPAELGPDKAMVYQQEMATTAYPMQYSKSHPPSAPGPAPVPQPEVQQTQSQQYYLQMQWDNGVGYSGLQWTEYHTNPPFSTDHQPQQFAYGVPHQSHQPPLQQPHLHQQPFYGNGHPSAPGQTRTKSGGVLQSLLG
ncbi:hypothetical protein VNI00_000866 [Paramarasmius palmivorus]|uniref:Xylanolytic transcriptional activator regulatory domain-containing protein n=1 Tax=Paramarasmius palmivorus TaxID=297713 RepID=A0AAW0E9Y5_9AGAR